MAPLQSMHLLNIVIIRKALEYNKSIDLTQLPKGVYFLRLATDNQNMVRKLVIN